MPNNGNSSYGGAQGRGNNTNTKQGYPRVPHDVSIAHQLRRYLQDQRDALNENRWLNDGLSDLTANQQTNLVNVLRQLSQARQTSAAQSLQIAQQQTDLGNLQNQLDAEIQANLAAHAQFTADIAANQAAYAALLLRVNCLDAAAGGVCP